MKIPMTMTIPMPSRATTFLLLAGLVVLAACSTSGTAEPSTSRAVPTADCAVAEPVDQFLTVDSAASGSADRVNVHFTPCTIDQQTPNAIIYLLHGAGADETQWPDVDIFTAADAAVLNGTLPPSILVAPDAAGFACKECASDLLDHLTNDIEPAVAHIAPVDTTRRAIGGISMGGAMALEVAGIAPNDFVAVGAHSAANASESALTAIATAGRPVRFDVGSDDRLAKTSERMSQFVDAHGGHAELVVGPGRHDRNYWRSQADDYIAFYAAHLR